MCITITVGERGRHLMGFSTTILNCVILLLSMALFVAGIAIRIRIDKRLEIMDDYNPGALPYYLIVTSFLLFFGHLVAVWFCQSATYAETRSDQHHYFVAVILALMVLFVLVLVSEIVMLVHSSLIYGALEDGMRNAMKAYKTDLDSKMRVDRLQLQFECCGFKTHKDWFKISWVNTMYINVLSPEVKPYLVDGEFIKDDVPFSCCSRHAKRACVHHSVGRFSQHEGISGSTLNQPGCATAIYGEFHMTLLAPTMWLLFIILVLQAVDIPLMRLLQTSIFTADEMNDPRGATEAYCIRGVSGGGDTRDLFKRKKSKDRDAEKGGGDDEKKTGWLSELKRKKSDDDDDDDDVDDDDDDDDDGGGGGGRGSKATAKGLLSKYKKGKGGDKDEDEDEDDKKNKKGGKKDKKNKKKKDKKDKKAKKKEEKKKKQAKKKEEKKKKKAKKKAAKAKKKKEKKRKKKEAKKRKKAAKKAKARAKKNRKKQAKQSKANKGPKTN